MKIDLHMKGRAPRLSSKKRPEVIRKWPIFFDTYKLYTGGQENNTQKPDSSHSIMLHPVMECFITFSGLIPDTLYPSKSSLAFLMAIYHSTISCEN